MKDDSQHPHRVLCFQSPVLPEACNNRILKAVLTEAGIIGAAAALIKSFTSYFKSTVTNHKHSVSDRTRRRQQLKTRKRPRQKGKGKRSITNNLTKSKRKNERGKKAYT
jgi:hypothetical protein